MTSAARDRFKELERERRQLRQANEILTKGGAVFCHWSEALPVRRHWFKPTGDGRALILRPLSSPQAATAAQQDGARPPVPQMIAFIKEHRSVHGGSGCACLAFKAYGAARGSKPPTASLRINAHRTK